MLDRNNWVVPNDMRKFLDRHGGRLELACGSEFFRSKLTSSRQILRQLVLHPNVDNPHILPQFANRSSTRGLSISVED